MVAVNFAVVYCGTRVLQGPQNPIVLLVNLDLFLPLLLNGVTASDGSVGSLILVVVPLEGARVHLLNHRRGCRLNRAQFPAVGCHLGAAVLDLNLETSPKDPLLQAYRGFVETHETKLRRRHDFSDGVLQPHVFPFDLQFL